MKPENFAEYRKTIKEIDKLNELLEIADTNAQQIRIQDNHGNKVVKISLTAESKDYGLDLGLEFVTMYKKHIMDIISTKHAYLNTL